jgi:hypothetical protein
VPIDDVGISRRLSDTSASENLPKELVKSDPVFGNGEDGKDSSSGGT